MAPALGLEVVKTGWPLIVAEVSSTCEVAPHLARGDVVVGISQ